MEDYEAHEQEFFAKLEEEEFSRASMLRRSAAAAFGLTILGASPSLAAAARRASAAAPPLKGTASNMAALVAAAKKEGHLNLIAMPSDWANYGEMFSTFTKKYGIPVTVANPNGTSAEENQAIVSLKGDPRAPDCVDDSAVFAISGAAQGLFAKYFNSNFSTIPRSMKDTRGYWTGNYWGAISIGYNAGIVKTPPKSFADLLKPEYKNQVALNGSPLTSGSAIAGVFAAALANGGSLSNISPGIDWFAKCKSVGNYIPVQSTPQTVASGQTPISIDWDYLNLGYGPQFPAAKWKVNIPADGVYGAYYCDAINATAPHANAARLWQELCYSDQGQLIWLKGFSHPARFTDMYNRKVIPKALIAALPSGALYAKVKFASLAQQTAAKAVINTQWPAKVGA
jgi:putative spermidine/putrescine transport system substrate-binding protein